MSKPTPLYTKTGDAGESGLANGQRFAKHDRIFDLLGTLDELSSHLGWAAVVLDVEQRSQILSIQDTLLTLGAIVARSQKVSLQQELIDALESAIDQFQENTQEDWYKHFLLPGGTEAASRVDIARTVCRRAERLLLSYQQLFDQSLYDQQQRMFCQQYLNRLSDYLYGLRCYVNSQAGYSEQQYRP